MCLCRRQGEVTSTKYRRGYPVLRVTWTSSDISHLTMSFIALNAWTADDGSPSCIQELSSYCDTTPWTWLWRTQISIASQHAAEEILHINQCQVRQIHIVRDSTPCLRCENDDATCILVDRSLETITACCRTTSISVSQSSRRIVSPRGYCKAT